jgi:hypothetical protein
MVQSQSCLLEISICCKYLKLLPNIQNSSSFEQSCKTLPTPLVECNLTTQISSVRHLELNTKSFHPSAAFELFGCLHRFIRQCAQDFPFLPPRNPY